LYVNIPTGTGWKDQLLCNRSIALQWVLRFTTGIEEVRG